MSKNNKILYPLLENAFSKEDMNCGIKVLKSKQITMSQQTINFEKKFARNNGSKYAVMTNSGSSANLLALSALINPLNKKRIKERSEVIIPAICWSTSLWPILQNNLKPVFVDVDINTYNISLTDLKKKISSKTKAIMLIHVLGLSTNMDELMNICKKKNIYLIEDTCESLGTKFKNKNLGTFGRFGTYSFYYSHQITSGEGGMVVCNNFDDYNLLKSLRSHGWSRGTIFEKKDKFNKFNFITAGYNLRPTDIQAAIANNQYKRLEKFKHLRNHNRNLIINSLKKSSKWNNQFSFTNYDEKKIKPSWFGLPILINTKLIKKKTLFLKYLESVGIETRPILSGNFLNQPACKIYKLDNPIKLKFANEIESRGFFIGLHTKTIKKNTLNFLVKNLMKIDEI